MFERRVLALWRAASSKASAEAKDNWTKADIKGAKFLTLLILEDLTNNLWACLVNSAKEEDPYQISSKITRASSSPLIDS
jgi:hypothetical protein